MDNKEEVRIKVSLQEIADRITARCATVEECLRYLEENTGPYKYEFKAIAHVFREILLRL